MEHREKKDLDQIQIRGLRVYAYHGVKESEKRKRAAVRAGHHAVDRYPPGWGDRPAGGYDQLFPCRQACAFSCRSKKDDLIERVAARVAEGISGGLPGRGA